LVGHLGFWINYDRDLTVRLWRGSALDRPKLDREDYVRRTLDKAFAGKGPDDGYQPDGSDISVNIGPVAGAEGECSHVP
jgi:hypothetical protein